MPQNTQLAQLLSAVAEHRSASFYRDLWGSKRRFEDLPAVETNDLVRVPLSRRRYKDEPSIVKIVQTSRNPFLVEWTFDDIAHEAWGVESKRPLVYMSDPQEALEKSVWCYENGMVPLVGESDAEITMITAEKYKIDSLIVDAPALEQLVPYLQKKLEPLTAISVVGESFSIERLRPFAAFARHMRLVWAAPAIGAFAYAPFSDSPKFETFPGCILTSDADRLMVTKTKMLVTPVIKYVVQDALQTPL